MTLIKPWENPWKTHGKTRRSSHRSSEICPILEQQKRPRPGFSGAFIREWGNGISV